MNDETDHWNETAEMLLYGDPSTAAERLKNSTQRGINEGIREHVRQEKLRAEHARSMAHLENFHAYNDGFKDPVIESAGRMALSIEQLRDLQGIGFDREKFNQQHGRDITSDDVAQMHLEARANGANVRGSDQLLNDVGRQLADKFGVRLHAGSHEESISKGMRHRMEMSARAHGKSIADYEAEAPINRQPNVDSRGGEPVTDESVKRGILQSFGSDFTPEMEAGRKSKISETIAEMQRSRGQDPEVQVSRNANDRRFPSRRAS